MICSAFVMLDDNNFYKRSCHCYVMKNRKFYSSKNVVYNFGKIGESLLFNLAEDFVEKFRLAKEASIQECEGVYTILRSSDEKELAGPYTFASVLIRNGTVFVSTERLYMDSQQNLRSAEMFDLANLSNATGELELKINEHHTIGINLNFLYEFGEGQR